MSPSSSMRRAWLVSILLSAFCGASACKKKETKAKPPETQNATPEIRELVKGVASEYRDLGHPIRDSLQVHQGDRVAVEAHFNAQQKVLFRKDYFESRVAFFRALSIPTLANGTDLRLISVKALSSAIVGFYDWNAHKLVLTDSKLGKLAGEEATLIHEVAHAIQGTRFSFNDLLEKAPSTTEGRNVFRCVTEGEAEALALELHLARVGKKLDSVQPDELDNGLGRVISGEMAHAYAIGRAFAVTRFQAGGWDAVQALTEELPVSTEQIIHAGKWGQDEPSDIDFPEGLVDASGAELIYDDVIGELGVFSQLATMGVSTNEAYLAATGWEADRLQVYRKGEGFGVAWLTRWDRPVDAQQIATVLEAHSEFEVTRPADNPLVVLFTHELEVGASDSLALQSENANDAASTLAAEEAWTVKEGAVPEVVAGRWHQRRLGFSIAVPEGWSAAEHRGLHILKADAEAFDFADNITVVEDPNLAGLDLLQSKEDLAKFTDSSPELTLVSSELDDQGERDLIRFHLSGRFPFSSQKVEALGVSFLHQGKTITITFTAASDTWDAVEPVARRTLGDIQWIR